MSSGDEFSHLDGAGRAQMVDISAKATTARAAVARGSVTMQASTLEALLADEVPKGAVLQVARLAGIMAAKRCDELIPLCHSLGLEAVELRFRPDRAQSRLIIEAQARCSGKTGVEMEALVAVSVAALTVVDMCKALDKTMIVGHTHLWHKRGGRSGEFYHPSPPLEVPQDDDGEWL